MAPGATIDLYIANGALPLSTAIAAVVAQDKVGDLSQSFGLPESTLSSMSGSSFALNIVLTDQYYMLGSAEGITFISSTGDVGRKRLPREDRRAPWPTRRLRHTWSRSEARLHT